MIKYYVVKVTDDRKFKEPAEVKGFESFDIDPSWAEIKETIIKHDGNGATVETQYKLK